LIFQPKDTEKQRKKVLEKKEENHTVPGS